MARTLILDIDGTLVDSNDANTRAWLKAFAAQNIHRSFAEVRRLVGMGGDQLIPVATGLGSGGPRFGAMSEGWKTAFAAEIPDLQAFAGTRAMVQAALAAGWRTVVATSGAPDLAARLLDLAHISDLLPDRVSGEDARDSKPQPDLMQVALEKVGARPEDTWMLGDTVYDVEAAHRAGLRCAFVRLGGNPDPENADAVFDDLAVVERWLSEDQR